MSAVQNAGRKLSHNELLDCLTDRRRRQILRLLEDQSGSLTERELAERLVVAGGAESIEDVSDATIEGVRIRLRHVHLPKLDDAGLLSWSERKGTVDTAGHPIYDDPEFQRLLDMEDDDWDDVVGSMIDDRLRRVLAVLEASDDGMRRDELAHRVAAREADGGLWGDDVEAVRTELHHVQLPKLQGAGLVEYDVDDGTITYQDRSSYRKRER